MKELEQKIGNTVRMLRQQRGVTQEQLAEFLGVTFQQVQKYERGHNRISAGKLKYIADFLKVNVMVFYGEDETVNQIESMDNTKIKIIRDLRRITCPRKKLFIRYIVKWILNDD